MSRIRKLAPLVGTICITALSGGCGAISQQSDAVSLIDYMRQSYGKRSEVTLQEAASVPYASIGVRVGDSNQVILVLGTQEQDTLLWTSAARISLITKNGRIVRTGGLSPDLTYYRNMGESRDKNGRLITRWSADFRELGLYGIVIACAEQQPEGETISILGKEIQTLRVEERCKSQDSQLDWSFKNIFWRDAQTQMVWRSLQHVSPKLDAISVDILRPLAAD